MDSNTTPQRYVASVSWGKDSLAMLFRLMEENMPLDAVIFCDTGMEYKAIYEARDKVLPLLKEKGIEYIEVKIDKTWKYWMSEHPVKKKGTQTVHKHGYGWCGKVRWGTARKLVAMKKHLKNTIQYVGIAYDEQKRYENLKENPDKRFPLVDWKMTEKDCLEYIYSKGIEYRENGTRLYDILPRVSCWCCQNLRIDSLYKIFKYLPEYWGGLCDMQALIPEPMKGKYGSIFELEEKFRESLQLESDIVDRGLSNISFGIEDGDMYLKKQLRVGDDSSIVKRKITKQEIEEIIKWYGRHSIAGSSDVP